MARVSIPGEVTRPDLPKGLNSRLFSGYQDILPEVKWPGLVADHQRLYASTLTLGLLCHVTVLSIYVQWWICVYSLSFDIVYFPTDVGDSMSLSFCISYEDQLKLQYFRKS